VHTDEPEVQLKIQGEGSLCASQWSVPDM